MLSISTCWNSPRHTDGKAMLQELMDLGFDTVELSHGIRLSLMQGVERMAGRVRFSSLHNFCPLPVEVFQPSPDCYQFSSHRKAERERAVKLTCETIDWAARLDVPVVVLHGRRVVMAPVHQRLVELAQNGQHLSHAFARFKTQAVMRREKISPTYIARLKDCLTPIVEYADKKGVRLALESRQYYEEIPTERELADLLDAYPTIGYWHDFGHVQTLENLAFTSHARWLARFAPRLLGCHVHDVVWPARDHRPPFTTGNVDYAQLLPLMPPETPLVWEISPSQTGPAIAESLKVWQERFC